MGKGEWMGRLTGLELIVDLNLEGAASGSS